MDRKIEQRASFFIKPKKRSKDYPLLFSQNPSWHLAVFFGGKVAFFLYPSYYQYKETDHELSIVSKNAIAQGE